MGSKTIVTFPTGLLKKSDHFSSYFMLLFINICIISKTSTVFSLCKFSPLWCFRLALRTNSATV